MKKILMTCTFVIISLYCLTQNLMRNGGFEEIDLNINPNPNPGDDSYSIEYAFPWKNLRGSCDIYHPNAPVALGAADASNTGVGSMRLWHKNEAAYGLTEPLIAGQVYEVSFFVKKQNQTLSSSYIGSMGLKITDINPEGTNFNSELDFLPQIEVVLDQTGEYQKVTYCYTAQSSGVHYVIISGKCPNEDPEKRYMIFVDDVSVIQKTDVSDMPQATISNTQNLVCLENNLLIDGSSSNNETSYQWQVHTITQEGIPSCLVYNSGWIEGQVGDLNFKEALLTVGNVANVGDCYRVYLYVDNGCRVRDYYDFCFEDVNINFLNGQNILCENNPIELSVTGDNGWNYAWTTGQNGLGLKTIQVTPTGSAATYGVTVTTPLGCTASENISFVVHSQNNLAPWMNGINGSGEYTIYVKQGDIVSFTSQLFNDHANENVTSNTNYMTKILTN